jgi:hypothetical protein
MAIVKTLDIGSRKKYPADVLSNFHPNAFVFEDFVCASMEGFLQSLKFDNVLIAEQVCLMVGYEAKKIGTKYARDWRENQILYWNGAEYKRNEEAYQFLLDHAYSALVKTNEKFRKALLDSENLYLVHTMGRTDIRETVLTEGEFCSRLMRLRYNLQTGGKGI